MKTVLCFGDSNTWGYNPVTGERYSYEQRWSGILQKEVGGLARIIEEGLNGRTTAWDEPFRPGRNGTKSLGPLLESHAPIDLLILMLGTNDMKHHYHVSPYESGRGLTVLIEIVKRSAAGPGGRTPLVLVVVPPSLGKLSEAMSYPYEGGIEKSAQLGKHYRMVATQQGCFFLDAGEHVEVSEADGVHLDVEGHQSLAQVLMREVKAILNIEA